MPVFMPPSVKTTKSNLRKVRIKNETRNNPCDLSYADVEIIMRIILKNSNVETTEHPKKHAQF